MYLPGWKLSCTQNKTVIEIPGYQYELICISLGTYKGCTRNTVEDRLSGMSGTWPAPDKRFLQILDILTLKQHNDQKK
jgi:hypothetical protein